MDGEVKQHHPECASLQEEREQNMQEGVNWNSGPRASLWSHCFKGGMWYPSNVPNRALKGGHSPSLLKEQNPMSPVETRESEN